MWCMDKLSTVLKKDSFVFTLRLLIHYLYVKLTLEWVFLSFCFVFHSIKQKKSLTEVSFFTFGTLITLKRLWRKWNEGNSDYFGSGQYIRTKEYEIDWTDMNIGTYRLSDLSLHLYLFKQKQSYCFSEVFSKLKLQRVWILKSNSEQNRKKNWSPYLD